MKKIYLIVSFIFLIGISLSILIFFKLQKYEIEKAETELSLLTNSYKSSIEHNIEDTTHIFYALSAYTYGSKHITKKEFQNFTKTILRVHPEVKSISWIPEVSYEKKEQFELQAKRDGIENFYIFSSTIDAKKALEKKKYYYPIYYNSSLYTNENKLGYDIASNVLYNDALLRTKNLKQITLSPP